MSAYTAYRVGSPLALDGSLSDPAWQRAPKSERFVDMATGEPALLDTRCAALWDDENLYVGFWVEEPYPAARQTERDSLIFRENDVEVFIDGGDCYYEFELNALNTVYEVFFIWRDAYAKGGRFDLPEFDVHEREAYTFGGNFDRTEEYFWKGTNPRGVRWAFLDWDFPGLQTAVHIDGALNDRSQPSKGWTAMLIFPWAGMRHLAGSRSLPPEDGDVWRLFLGRFQKLAVGESQVQAAWCLSPHGVYDTHMPEKFTPVRFSRETV
ncbi:MAG TPA: carbohydrate-binding family 9-like protein [Fimbriimonadaceae bacterium]|nr:carbohydrate-binding family 9-like protein [Fimbriimonadaceae bacterium]